MDPKPHQMNHSNPSLLIFHHYEPQILSARNSLFSSLKATSDSLAIAAERILERKINSKNEKSLPHLFEIYPWLLKDLTNLDFGKAHAISVNWLALYMYVFFLDDHLDLKTKIEPDEFLAASVLAQMSVINLFKIVDNTKYENLFRDSLIRSAKYELKDVIEQTLVCNDNFSKSESASGKNSILLACASAVAASTGKDSDFIIDLSRELLLSIQLLDDLTDIEEDIVQGNITIPLNIFGSKLAKTSLDRNEIITLMLQSKSLYNTIERIESSLAKVVKLIHALDIKIHPSNPAIVYFQDLLTVVSQLKLFIESIEGSFNTLTVASQKELIKELETKLTQIYCHT